MRLNIPALILLLHITTSSFAQLNFDSLIVSNTNTFQVQGAGQFSGKGWDQLVERAQKTNYVLIGEDHFISEVPLFTQALMQNLSIDNYICEIDQWMLNIFKNKITALNAAQLDDWVSANYNGFSFFQKKNEFELMRNLVKQKVNLIGIEQVGLMSTTIVFQYLTETGNQKNRKHYQMMRDSSANANSAFFADQSKPFFFTTPFFSETIQKLDKQAMNADEAKLVNGLIRSADIYKTGSHRSRIKLMQSNLMELYPHMLKGKKNVFKFGANHTLKGESYIPVYDIGTTANILAQAENQDSYHILILPKAGNQAGFLGGSNAIDLNDELYSSLKPFFERSSNKDWSLINLEKIREEVRRQKFIIRNPILEKTIKGYDVLVVIPFASAAAAVK